MLYQTFRKTFRRAIQGVNKSRTYPCDVRPSLIGNLQHKEGLLGRLVVIAEGDEGRQLPFTESCVGVRHNTSSVIGSSRRLLLCFFFTLLPQSPERGLRRKMTRRDRTRGRKPGFPTSSLSSVRRTRNKVAHLDIVIPRHMSWTTTEQIFAPSSPIARPFKRRRMRWPGVTTSTLKFGRNGKNLCSMA